jgi:hypothetical protein
MKSIKHTLAVVTLGFVFEACAFDLPELNQQNIAAAMGAVSMAVTAYNQLSKFLASPDAKQMKYQPYIQAFLDDAGMVTDKELQTAVDKQNAQLEVIKAAVNLLADGKNVEARTLLQSAASVA